RFVHWHQEIPGAVDALLVAERFVECLAESDADVFDRVVLVNIEVAFASELQVESAVASKELEHVIEEANAGGNLVGAASIDGKRKLDVGFVGVPINGGF